MSQKKLTPQSGQKGLKSYLQPKGKPGFGCPLSTSTPKQDNSIVKKRTPPSIENPARKRKTTSSPHPQKTNPLIKYLSRKNFQWMR